MEHERSARGPNRAHTGPYGVSCSSPSFRALLCPYGLVRYLSLSLLLVPPGVVGAKGTHNLPRLFILSGPNYSGGASRKVRESVLCPPGVVGAIEPRSEGTQEKRSLSHPSDNALRATKKVATQHLSSKGPSGAGPRKLAIVACYMDKCFQS